VRTLDDLLIDAGAALDERCAELEPSTSDRGVGRSPRRHVVVGAAASVVAVASVAFLAVRDGGDRASVAPGPPATAPISETLDTLPSTSSDSTMPASTGEPSTTIPSLTGPIAKGSSGEDVRRVEERLAELGFFVGEIDGEFDSLTQQAVWAWKKVVGDVSWQEFDDDPAKTTVTSEIWQQMLQSTDIAPRRPQGDESTHVEIYLPLQVMAVFTGDRPVLIGHVSSGEVVDDGVEPTTFCEVVTLDTDANGEPIDPPQEQAICAQTRTPGGVFEITRRLDGTRIGPLGGMYRPQYFNYGIGIHGAENVPTRPVSHGMVRISKAAADAAWSLLDRGDRVYVWGQDGQEPEEYERSESLPSFLYPAPDGSAVP
jgi:peptidoglycan hydrolase-like protein with peptidoglycan-binding domain